MYHDVRWLEKNALDSKESVEGAFVVRSFWLKGHLMLGEHINGYTGPETVIKVRSVRATRTFLYFQELETEYATAA